LKQDPLLRGAALLTAAGLLGQALGFVYRIALSRALGAEYMGLYQLVLQAYAVGMALVSVGPSFAASRLTAEFSARGDKAAQRVLLRQCARLFLPPLLLFGAAVFCFSDPISVYLLGDARTQLPLLVLVPCIALTAYENIHKYHLYGAGSVRLPAASELAELTLRMCAVLLLLAYFRPHGGEKAVALVVCGMVLSELFSATFLPLVCRARLSGGRATCDRRALRRRILRTALPVGATALLGNLMGTANAVLIPMRLAAAGWSAESAMRTFGVVFGMALPLLMLPYAFVAALCTVLMPRLARCAATGDLPTARALARRAFVLATVILVPAVTLLTLAGPFLGTLLFREETISAWLPSLAAGVVFSAWQGVFASALGGMERHGRAAANALFCGGVQLAFTWVGTGIRGVGMGGFLAGFCVSGALGALLNAAALRRALRPAKRA